MRIVLQRVKHARVIIEDKEHAHITCGLVLLIGFDSNDNNCTIDKAVHKIVHLRVFSDVQGKMNLSIADIKGSMLLIPNFTLAAETAKGNRPSFDSALNGQKAKGLFTQFIDKVRNDIGGNVVSGIFGSDMLVELVNDGPVTFVLDF